MSKIITTPDYWDCECENNYIHPRKHDECKVCGSIEEEQPESRLSEVTVGRLKMLIEALKGDDKE